MYKSRVIKDHKNLGQSVNIDGRSTANQHIITDAFNKYFTAIPDMINKIIDADYCLTKTSFNNQNMLSYSLKHAFQNLFPSIKCNCSTTKEIENIIMSLESSNPFGYDEVPTKILKLYSLFISFPLNYMS